MKISIRTVKLAVGMLSLMATMTLTSCKKNQETDSKAAAEETNDAMAEAKDSITDARAGDSDYLVAAAETDLMEIELGKLALTKTSNAKVKELANMMITQHTKASETLKPLAASKQITIPATLTEKGKEHYDDLNKKSGVEFDKAYADLMVEGHEDAISKIKDASKDAKDTEIKQWATAMLPTLNTHLEHAKMLKDLINKTK